MDLQETIEYFGVTNSRSCYPKRYEEIDQSLPYFKVYKENDRYNISIYNFIGHDNADRMPFICRYLLSNIFPYVKSDLSGFYNIQLHDSYTYLDDKKNYRDVLTFGSYKNDKGPIILPDIYFISNWGNKYSNFKDPITFKEKKAIISFYGTTTGDRDPTKNERIQTCLWAIDKPECHFKITKIAQMNPDTVYTLIPQFSNIYTNPVSLLDQFKNKYQLIIDGNVSKWDVDCYFSKCLGFAMPSRNMLWYHPLLQAGTHHVNVNLNNILQTYNYYENNPHEAEHIVKNSNKLAQELFKPENAHSYTIALFENIGLNK